jgi:deoxyxylulose-5-phosphate synthase
MGLYDIAYMLAVPGMTVTAPKDGDELIGLLKTALAHQGGPFCTRYPRDKAPAEPPPPPVRRSATAPGRSCAPGRTAPSSRSA